MAAWTWEEILTDALSLSGMLGQGQVVNALMLSEAKKRARALLDELDGEGIALPLFSTNIEFDTVSNQERYVLGTGSDPAPADPVRPELILDAQIRIQGGAQPVFLPLRPISFPSYRNDILVPQNLSQPINYSWNPKWPQGDFYLWPVPNQEWLIRLTATVKWIDVVTDPVTETTTLAELPSGYTNAFINVLALRIAQRNAIETQTLKSRASQAKYVMSTYTFDHVPQVDTTPSAFPWNISRAGINPPR